LPDPFRKPEPTGNETLFHERREDLAVSFFQDHPPAVVHTFWSGKAVRGGRLVYRSAPLLDPGPPELSKAVFEQFYADFSHVMVRKRSGLLLSAHGVAFDQRIMVVRPGVDPIEDRRTGARLRLECRLGQASAIIEAIQPFDQPIDAEALLEHVERRQEAAEPPSGELPVIFAPGVGGVLVHEIVGHALEADTILGGRSWLAQLEEPIAPRGLLILDDPRRGRGAWRIDDEGVPARATALVSDGVVAGWLHDRKSARLSGRPPTGHGRCSSFREPVRPRMGCTFVAPGSFASDELLQGVERGIYVRRMEAANTDTKTGNALFRVTDSDRILAGKLDAPLKPLLLHVNGAQALASMAVAEDDLVFDACVGSCHRDGQPLAISVGAPTMRIGGAAVK
jgi:hypothetical protein